MNAKVKKIENEIEKTKEKIGVLQNKVKEFEKA